MLAFRYDATFEGLLSAVFDAYTRKEFPGILLTPGETAPLTVDAVHTVMTSRPKADRVFVGLTKRMTRIGQNTVLLAFLSEQPGISTVLFRYIQKMFDAPPGSAPESNYADPDIFAADTMARKVYAERGHLLGFARFQKTAEGIYFAALSPKYNSLSLLLPHFSDRFSGHPWAIYDARRGFGFYYTNGVIRDMRLEGDILEDGRLPARLLAQGENFFHELWRTYLDSASIRERMRPSLQIRCLPRRFWPHMTEKGLLGGEGGGRT